ncbi:methyl-accepting chemotaxis protein [Xanthobacter agilis]|jgi:methyl-accepting chemotaxis protein|uniref:methyl-accepting chemotaxis protein n=1 Tax=Xanthobacter agilis TaxID=47492 RepID=UPI003728DF91
MDAYRDHTVVANGGGAVIVASAAEDRTGTLAAGITQAARLLGDLSCLLAWGSGNAQRLSGESVAISGAVEELARTTDNIASAATSTYDQSTDAARIVSQTVGQAAQAASAIGDIASAFSDIQSRIGQLTQAIRAIGEMARDIDTISKQTKLLSLNATIEAARAGAAGLGFGVVASEVKALSEQTARTTANISAKLAELNQVLAAVSQAVADGGGRVESGTRAFNEVSRNMDQVSERVGGATERIESISHALGEQKTATNSIAASLAEVARLATQNKADGDSSGALLAKAQAAAMTVLDGLDVDGDHAYTPMTFAAELANWRGALAQCLVGARADRAYDDPPFGAERLLPPIVREAVAPHLTAIRAAARELGRKLQAGDIEGAIKAYTTADGHLTEVTTRLAG